MKKGFTVGVTEVRKQYLFQMSLCVLVFYVTTKHKTEKSKVGYLTRGFIPIHSPKCY
jgi:hypothetical protein